MPEQSLSLKYFCIIVLYDLCSQTAASSSESNDSIYWVSSAHSLSWQQFWSAFSPIDFVVMMAAVVIDKSHSHVQCTEASSIICVFQGGQNNSVLPHAVLGLLKSFSYWLLLENLFSFLHLPNFFDVALIYCRDHFRLPCNAITGLDLTVLVLVWSRTPSLGERNQTTLHTSRWSVQPAVFWSLCVNDL